MSTALRSPEPHASAAGHHDQATRHHHRASKLFEKDHAYAARLVQIATAIRSELRSPVRMDRLPSELERVDTITTSIVRTPATHSSGP